LSSRLRAYHYDIDTACQFLAQVPAYTKLQRMLPHINSQMEKPEQEEILVLTTDGNWHIPAADGDFFACLNFNWNDNNKQLELNYNRTDNTNKQWGAASGFLALCLYQSQKSRDAGLLVFILEILASRPACGRFLAVALEYSGIFSGQ